MKHTIHIYLIPTLFIITFSFTMDKPLPRMIVKEITAVQNPCKAFFTADNRLAIGEDAKTQEDSGAYLVNWKENKTLRTVFKGLFLYPYCFRNQQRDTVVANPISQIATYDLEGNKTYEFNRKFCIATITRSNTLYAIEANGTMHSNKTDKTWQLPSKQHGILFNEPTAHHAKEQIFFTEWLSNKQSRMYTTDINDSGIMITYKDMPIISNPFPYGDAPVPHHSPINDTMAIFWPFKDTWSLYDPNKNSYIIEDIENGLCRIVTFHPQKYNLLALLTKDGFVKLYNANTKTVIASTENSLGKTSPSNSFNKQMMDFSADGKEIAVIVDDKCFVLSDFDQYID